MRGVFFGKVRRRAAAHCYDDDRSLILSCLLDILTLFVMEKNTLEDDSRRQTLLTYEQQHLQTLQGSDLESAKRWADNGGVTVA